MLFQSFRQNSDSAAWKWINLYIKTLLCEKEDEFQPKYNLQWLFFYVIQKVINGNDLVGSVSYSPIMLTELSRHQNNWMHYKVLDEMFLTRGNCDTMLDLGWNDKHKWATNNNIKRKNKVGEKKHNCFATLSQFLDS